MVEVRSKFDSEITKPLTRLQLRRMILFFILISVFLVFFGTIIMIFPESDSNKSFGLFLIVFGVSYFPIFYLAVKIMQKSFNKSMKLMNAETLSYIKFTEERIYDEAVKGEEFKSTSEFSYSIIYKAVETKSHFFIFISKRQTQVIPKKDIITGTAEELKQILSSRLGKKYKFYNMK